MNKLAFGIDIGGTTVKIGCFDKEGKLLKKWEIPTRKEDSGIHILPDVAEAVGRELEANRLDVSDVVGMGIGVPGAVVNETTVNKCANLGWDVIDVAKIMKELTGIRQIKVGNDANVAALGEMYKGGAMGYENMVMVTLGTGVGGGIVLNGKIVPGAFGAGGEIGHLPVNKHETRVCGCGKKGHLEQYASATGIVRKATEALEQTDRPSSLREMKELTAKDVIDAAKAGDGLALEILDSVGDMLGRALAMISCTIDPQAYVIGGGVSKAGDILLDTIRSHFRKYAFHASEEARIELASLGNDAGIYGAVKMVLP